MSRILPKRKQLESPPVDSAGDCALPSAASDAMKVEVERSATESFQPQDKSLAQGSGRSPLRRAVERHPTVIMPAAATQTEESSSEPSADEIVIAAESAEESFTELDSVIAGAVDSPERMQTVILPSPPHEACEDVPPIDEQLIDVVAEPNNADTPVSSSPSPQAGSPISPRRKRRREQRNARSATNVEERALETAAEIEQMLASLGPSVIECWTSKEDAQSMIVLNDNTANIANSFTAPLLMVNEFVPQVVEIRVEVPAPSSDQESIDQAPLANEAFAQTQAVAVPTDESLSPTKDSQIAGAVSTSCEKDANEEASSPGAQSRSGDDLPTIERAPTVELVFTELPLATYSPDGHDETAPLEDDRTPTELELSFNHRELPRRREPETPWVSAEPPDTIERDAARLDAYDQPSPKVAQDLQVLGTSTATQWETRLRNHLRDPELTAALGRLLDQWQRDGEHLSVNTLLLASLGSPHVAADVVMGAGLQLVERTGAAVLVIDADADGALSRQMGLTGKLGLSDTIAAPNELGEAICPTATERLHVLPCGKIAWPAKSPAAALRHLLAELTPQYAWILAAGGGSQTPLVKALARECRATYVVAPLGELAVEDAQRELANLRNAGARVLGSMVVRND
jgi:Mrp family chromosome partitioning ATPase